MTTVRDLIKHLQTLNQDLPIVYGLHSENRCLNISDLTVQSLQPARADGWVHDVWNGEPALPTVEYLVFPGN